MDNRHFPQNNGQVTCENMDNCETCGANPDCPCVKGSLLIDNTVLTYGQNFLGNYDVNLVAKALDAYFPENALLNARNILREKCSAILQGMDIMKIKHRVGSTLRSSSMANAQDIADAIYKIANNDVGPTFVTSDLRKLPILMPDMLEDNSLAVRIAKLEKQMMKMEEWKEEKDNLLGKDGHKVKKLEDYVKNCTNESQVKTPASVIASSSQWPTPEMAAAWKKPPNYATTNNVMGTPQVHQPDKVEGPTQMNEWQKQPHQRKKEIRDQKKNEGSNRNRRNQSIQGSAADTDVKAGPGPNRDLWIYNVDKAMSDDDLRTFVEEGGSSKSAPVHIRLWEPRYETHWDTKKFRLTIGLSDYNRVFNADFWPKDIWIRKYWVNFERDKKNKEAGKSTSDVVKETGVANAGIRRGPGTSDGEAEQPLEDAAQLLEAEHS